MDHRHSGKREGSGGTPPVWPPSPVPRTSRPPAGANNFLRWRRSVAEHLESRRLTWPEYAMLNWLCTKADPYKGTLRTSWAALAVQTGLTPAYAARLCRRLRQKRYVFYSNHRGRRGGPVLVAIDKFPLPGELYTDLTAWLSPGGAPATGHGRRGPEASASSGSTAMPPDRPPAVRAEVRSEVRSDVRPERPRQTRVTSPVASPLRREEGEIETGEITESRPGDPAPTSGEGDALDREAALEATPSALRATLELYCDKTGRSRVSRRDLDWLARLDYAHPPSVIQKAISTVVERARARGHAAGSVTLAYVAASLPHLTSRRPPPRGPVAAAGPRRPPGVTRLE